ncbi:MAG TPA: hypothetical protein VHR66_18590 [Gemmataceae bacterium]|jgi:hypothetical protein|nr:hypothetical protein [Gemmataceae bacterium]
MRSRHRISPRIVCLEARITPANVLQVETLWINPTNFREFTPAGTLVGEVTRR